MEAPKRILEMNTILEQQTALLQQLTQLLDEIEATHPNFIKLRAYYGSEDFHHDCGLYQTNQLPIDKANNVLSEDGIYNMIFDQYQTAIRMLEIATTKLKDY